MYYIPKYTIGGYLCHHGILEQKWGVRNGPPYPLSYGAHTAAQKKANPKSVIGGGSIKIKKKREKVNDSFDPFEAMAKIDKSLSKKEQDLLGVGNDNSTDDIQFFFNKDLTAYLITADYHGKYKDEHPISGKVIGIAAEPKARGTGATDKLISDAKKKFPNDRLVAEIDKGNVASRKLFERNGFEKVKEDNGVDYYIYGKRR